MKHGIFSLIAFPLLLVPVFFCCRNSTTTKTAHPSQLVFPAYAYAPPKPQNFRDTLSNGITVYLVEDHRLPVFDIIAIVRTGDLFEPDSLAGLAGITASLMHSGSTRSFTGDEVDKKAGFLAARLSVGMSSTAATASLSILAKDRAEGLALFADMLMRPVFAQDKLGLEKKHAYEAIDHRFDNGRTVLSVGFAKYLYGNFPAGRQATKQTVARITRRHVENFYGQWFCPENIILAASGDFARNNMRAVLDSLFGAWKKTGVPRQPFPAWQGNGAAGRVIFVEHEANQAYIQMGHKCIQRPHEDYYALSVLNEIVGGGGFNSRLTDRVRSDEGLVYDVRSSVESNYFFNGAFTIRLQTKSRSAAYAMALCLEEMRRACSEKVTEPELSSAKRKLISSFPAMFRTPTDIASAFAWNEYWGRPFDHFDTYCSKIEALTTADLLSAAQRHLHPDSLTTVVVGTLADCRDGDGEHKATLADFGTIETVDVKELGKNQKGN